MSGRHSAQPASKSRAKPRAGRRSRSHSATSIAGGVVGLLIVALFAALVWPRVNGGARADEPHLNASPSPSSTCDVPLTLRVVADPRIAPVLTKLTDRFASPGGTTCVSLQVLTEESSAAAADIAANGATNLKADVWIPDSSMWLAVAHSTGVGDADLPDAAPIVATSPIVLAMTSQQAGAQKTPIRWDSLGELAKTPDKVVTAVADPARSTPGLAVLLASAGNTTANLAVTKLRQLSRGVTIVPDLASALHEIGQGKLSSAPMAESDLLNHNADAPAPLVAGRTTGIQPVCDYRLVTLGRSDSSPEHAQALEVLRTVLLSPDGVSALAEVGLRQASGAAIPGAATRGGSSVDITTPSAADPHAVANTLARWAVTGRRGHVLGVIDVSGSMSAVVPGTTRTRMQLAIAASQRAVAAFDSDTELGIWKFSTQVAGNADFKELVPVRPLNTNLAGRTQRRVLNDALGTLTFKPGGGTALYTTVAAAVDKARHSFIPGRLNAVVVLTDGADSDPRTIGLPALLKRLKDDAVPGQPVRVIMISYGGETDAGAMKAISAATGAKSYISKDPRDIDKVLAEALAEL